MFEKNKDYVIEYKQDKKIKIVKFKAPNDDYALSWWDVESAKYPGVVIFLNLYTEKGYEEKVAAEAETNV